MNQSYPNEYIHFLYEFMINAVYTKAVRSINLHKKLKPDEFINKFIELSATKELWDPIFTQLHYIIKYYINVSNMPEITEAYEAQSKYDPITPSTLYTIYTSFQTYVDYMVNLNNTCGWDYSKFIENMKDKTFEQNLKTKWKLENKQNALYNKIITHVMNHVFLSCNRFDLIENKSYYDNGMPLFLNIIPFYEYVNVRNASKYDTNLEKSENKPLNEIEFENLETSALNMIYDYVK